MKEAMEEVRTAQKPAVKRRVRLNLFALGAGHYKAAGGFLVHGSRTPSADEGVLVRAMGQKFNEESSSKS